MATTINHTATHPTTGETFTRSSVSRTYTHAVLITRPAGSNKWGSWKEATWAEWSGRETLAEANAARQRAEGNTAIVVPASSSTKSTTARTGATAERHRLTREAKNRGESAKYAIENALRLYGYHDAGEVARALVAGVTYETQANDWVEQAVDAARKAWRAGRQRLELDQPAG